MWSNRKKHMNGTNMFGKDWQNQPFEGTVLSMPLFFSEEMERTAAEQKQMAMLSCHLGVQVHESSY